MKEANELNNNLFDESDELAELSEELDDSQGDES